MASSALLLSSVREHTDNETLYEVEDVTRYNKSSHLEVERENPAHQG